MRNWLQIMRIKTIYYSVDDNSETNLIAHCNGDGKMLIKISNEIDYDDNMGQSIVLDKKTAIRLAKDLRREISFMED